MGRKTEITVQRANEAKDVNKRDAFRRKCDILAREVGCLACKQLGFLRTAEMHHPFGRTGEQWRQVIPLCEWHHRGVPWCWVDHKAWNPERLGPSLAYNKPAFHEEFGSDEELLAETDRLFAEVS